MTTKLTFILAFLVSVGASGLASEPPKLPLLSPLFGDNMVLQREKPIRFWGWTRPGDSVRVELAGSSATAIAEATGRWQTEITPPAPGGPYTVQITCGTEAIVLHEVLIGDVWLCGGQSNMEMGMGRVRNAQAEIKQASHPEIRLFTVAKQVSYSPAATVEGSWKICSPQTVAEAGWNGFSAVAYYFGRKLQSEINVPVGLVVDAYGGTPAESWTTPETLRKLGEFGPELDEVERLRAKGGPQFGSFLMHWLAENDLGESNHWSAANFDAAAWRSVQIPGGFAEIGLAEVPGIGWFRKELILPDPLPAGEATLNLGMVDKMDTAYLNGQFVGASSWVENPRAYVIANHILRPGTNVLVVRVFKNRPAGGFLSAAAELNLTLGDQTKIPLAGEWKGVLSLDARPPHNLPLSYENYPTMPAVLNEGMLAPVIPFSITGVIWYQGEANAGRAYQYRTVLPAMIADWRRQFAQGDFPFYIVSLPAFMKHQNQPGDSGWAELREAQALTARSIPNGGLAVTVDTGDANDIHPQDKVEVGERLALCALARHYAKNIPFQGPTYASMENLPGALKLHFAHADGGLVVKGDKLEEFSVAGADHQWHWADAVVAGDSIVVSSPQVPEPRAARYAWQPNPKATLFNGAGLPAGPFRTDDWPGVTQKQNRN